jgi:cation diffusion facilitator CzcD-associated flavoprotein CzcO
MRGSHPGSFEVAHALRDGTFPKAGTKPTETGERYDLILVGGGISGLAADHFYRAKRGADTRILILDNHDDFGGHAKRNRETFGEDLPRLTQTPQSTRPIGPSKSCSRAGCAVALAMFAKTFDHMGGKACLPSKPQ